MVKKYSELYLDARQVLMETEGSREAGRLAREVIMQASGKNQAELIAASELYAQDDVIEKTNAMVEPDRH